uniref:G_PROTEIN_RECEP_F1_2 domain-containing protein n=1 Tax=Steinernema glaseri TaxID=37863 RepID=A0A1I7Z7M0_9BILA
METFPRTVPNVRHAPLGDYQNLYYVYASSIPIVLLISLIPPGFLFYNVENSSIDRCQLNLVWAKDYTYSQVAIWMFFNASIIVSYILILVRYQLQVKARGNAILRNSQRHLNRIVFGIILVYFLMWCIPKWITYGLKTAGARGVAFQLSSFAVINCEQLSACVNVVVYGYTHRDLREGMKTFLRRITRKHVHSSSAIAS